MTIGRISVDIYGQEEGCGLEDPQSFMKAVGGSPTNVAIGSARYGNRSAVITAVGNDSMGRYALAELDKFKVARDFVTVTSGRTPVVIAGLKDPDDPEIIFYRETDAPDTQIEVTPALERAVAECRIFWYTGSTLSHPKLRSRTLELLSARPMSEGRENIFDLDYRPSFWNNEEKDAHREISSALKFATIVLGNRKECAVATGLPETSDSLEFAQAILDSGARLAIIKDGSRGVLVAEKSGSTLVEGIRVKTRCGLGAGDAFGAGIVHGVLKNWSSRETVKFANAAGAYVARELMCSDAMPNELQVRELLAGQ
jgi:5-dehydro-2-deoxygluconokinase